MTLEWFESVACRLWPHNLGVYRANPIKRSTPGRTAGTDFRILESPALDIEGTIRNRVMKGIDLVALEVSPGRPDQLLMEEISKVASASMALRRWELAHLPTNSSHLGFELFMMLVHESALDQGRESIMLKRIYLSLPFSEKGLRIHLRRLEEDGWIVVQKSEGDFRHSRVSLSNKAWAMARKYADIFVQGPSLRMSVEL
jgi:hypothetical protein